MRPRWQRCVQGTELESGARVHTHHGARNSEGQRCSLEVRGKWWSQHDVTVAAFTHPERHPIGAAGCT